MSQKLISTLYIIPHKILALCFRIFCRILCFRDLNRCGYVDLKIYIMHYMIPTSYCPFGLCLRGWPARQHPHNILHMEVKIRTVQTRTTESWFLMASEMISDVLPMPCWDHTLHPILEEIWKFKVLACLACLAHFVQSLGTFLHFVTLYTNVHTFSPSDCQCKAHGRHSRWPQPQSHRCHATNCPSWAEHRSQRSISCRWQHSCLDLRIFQKLCGGFLIVLFFLDLVRFYFCEFRHSWAEFPHKSVNHCCVAYDSSAIRSAPRLLQNISKTPRNENKMTKKDDKMWSNVRWQNVKQNDGRPCKTLTAPPSTRDGHLEADVMLQARKRARDDLRPSTWKKS